MEMKESEKSWKLFMTLSILATNFNMMALNIQTEDNGIALLAVSFSTIAVLFLIIYFIDLGRGE